MARIGAAYERAFDIAYGAVTRAISAQKEPEIRKQLGLPQAHEERHYEEEGWFVPDRSYDISVVLDSWFYAEGDNLRHIVACAAGRLAALTEFEHPTRVGDIGILLKPFVQAIRARPRWSAWAVNSDDDSPSYDELYDTEQSNDLYSEELEPAEKQPIEFEDEENIDWDSYRRPYPEEGEDY